MSGGALPSPSLGIPGVLALEAGPDMGGGMEEERCAGFDVGGAIIPLASGLAALGREDGGPIGGAIPPIA